MFVMESDDKTTAYKHPTALVETEDIGDGTRIWAFAHILSGASVGSQCNICDGVFIESHVRIGNGVTIKNGVYLWKGVTVEDYVFIGPNATFTNDRTPRSARAATARRHHGNEDWLETTLLKSGCSIGANSTIVCGTTIGKFAIVAAGAVVTRDVEDYALVAGVPAHIVGFVCTCGRRVNVPGEFCSSECVNLYRKFETSGGTITS